MRNLLRTYKKIIKKFLASISRKRFNWKKKVTKFFKVFYLLILLPIDLVGHLLTFWKNNQEVETLNKVLIVKTDQYGDVLFSTFLIPLIKKKYPQAEIHYLINPKTEVLLKQNPNIDKVYFWKDPLSHFILGREEERGSFLNLVKRDYNTLRKIRKENYNLIINTRAFVPSSNIPFKLMGGDVLAAFDVSEQSFLADYCADYDFKEEEWKNYLELLKPIDITVEEYSPQFYNFDPGGLKEKFSDQKNKLVAIAPISFDQDRLWKKEKWQKVINQLKDNYQIVLTGLPSQRDYLSDIADEFGSKVKVFTNLTISQLGSLINQSQALLCIDAFATHLGIALKTPTFCLVNPEAYYLPGFSKPKKFIEAKSMVPLVNLVSVFPLRVKPEEVINKFERLK